MIHTNKFVLHAHGYEGQTFGAVYFYACSIMHSKLDKMLGLLSDSHEPVPFS